MVKLTYKYGEVEHGIEIAALLEFTRDDERISDLCSIFVVNKESVVLEIPNKNISKLLEELRNIVTEDLTRIEQYAFKNTDRMHQHGDYYRSYYALFYMMLYRDIQDTYAQNMD